MLCAELALKSTIFSDGDFVVVVFFYSDSVVLSGKFQLTYRKHFNCSVSLLVIYKIMPSRIIRNI